MDRNQARKLISKIATRYPAHIRFSKHALDEMRQDNLTTVDILNIIKSASAKIIKEGELENGSYRYRLETTNITVVVSFDSQTSVVVVTAWRNSI